MKTLYVYILRCGDGSYYTGVTNDLDRRIAEHNSNLLPNCYTYRRQPVELVWTDSFSSDQAIAVEKQIKGWSRRKKEAMIQRDWDTVRVLAACKNVSSSRRLWEEDWRPKTPSG